MKRCAIYARYSSENQREASIEDQVRICRARAAHEGWTVEAVHTDYAVSGTTTRRPGYQTLLSDIQARRIDIVLCESLDRLSRDQEHIASFYKQASFAGARIVTLDEVHRQRGESCKQFIDRRLRRVRAAAMTSRAA